MNESLGSRMRRFFTLVGVLTAITMGVVISQRLSDDALAMLIGLVFGVALMLPLAGVGLLLWRREAQSRPATAPQSGAPPVIVVTPSSLPPRYESNVARLAPPPSWQPEHAARTFTVLGGEEVSLAAQARQ